MDQNRQTMGVCSQVTGLLLLGELGNDRVSDLHHDSMALPGTSSIIGPDREVDWVDGAGTVAAVILTSIGVLQLALILIVEELDGRLLVDVEVARLATLGLLADIKRTRGTANGLLLGGGEEN
jgi:hypothetical protein